MDLQIVLGNLVSIFTLAQRPAPFPAHTNEFRPDLSCLGNFRDKEGHIVDFRDKDGLIMQWQESPEKPLDGGDSAHHAGVLAFCESERDRNNLPRYMLDTGLMVRHPKDYPWNNPWNSSRDQLLGYLSGCWRSQQFEIAKVLYKTHEEREPPFTCQNIDADEPGTPKPFPFGDVLTLENIMYFRVCCGDFGAVSDMAGQLQLYIAILTTPDDENVEINQIILMSIVCGQLDLFVETHPHYREALRKYWGSSTVFRYQPCIAEAFINVIELELSRYSGRSVLDLLLPAHLWTELKNIDIVKAITSLQIANPIWMAEMASRLAVAALKDVVERLLAIGNTVATLTKLQAELRGALFAYGKKLVKDVQTYAQKNLGPAGDVIAPALGVASAMLGLFTGNNDDEERAFREQTRRDLAKIINNTDKILNDLATLNTLLAKQIAEYKDFINSAFQEEVVQTLLSQVDAATINVAAYQMHPNDDDKRSILDAINICRPLISRAATFGAGALPHCLHAFSFVIQCLSVLDDQDEIMITREHYREKFKDLYFGPGGLHTQLMSLNAIIDGNKRHFDLLVGKQIVGIRSKQKYKAVFNPQFDPPHEILPLQNYEVFVDGFDCLGTIGDIASFRIGDLTTSSWGSVSRSLADRASVIAETGLSLAETCKVFVIPCYVGPVDRNDPDEWQNKELAKALNFSVAAKEEHRNVITRLSSEWLLATQSLRQVEGLAISVTSTFGFS